MLFGNDKLDIEYLGRSGITQDCMDAILRLLQYNERIVKARILTCSREHGFILTNVTGFIFAVRSGFASGYSGAGPKGLSYIIQLLESHGIEIDEYKVDKSFLNRLNNSSLTNADLNKLEKMKPVHSLEKYDYVYDRHCSDKKDGKLWKNFRPVIPFAIIDERIIDLALAFWENPDDIIMNGYKRLESTIRNRINSRSHSTLLFEEAFKGIKGGQPKLVWEDTNNQSEIEARCDVFKAAFRSSRNPLAHKEMKRDITKQLSEFLLLNHLYKLESEARKVNEND